MLEANEQLSGAWLKCSIEPGMLPNEFAVELNTLNVGKISLFADKEKVRPDESLMRVELLASGDSALVRLPSYPFEISNRNVWVSSDALIEFESSQQRS